MAPDLRDERIDTYLAGRPADQQVLLADVRATVHRLVPRAEETISYGMPAFALDGRVFFWMAGWKAHCSVYPMSDELLAEHGAELEGYGRTKGALHFTAARPLPPAVLAALVLARAAEV